MPKTREEIEAQYEGIRNTIEAERTAISEDGGATGERPPPVDPDEPPPAIGPHAPATRDREDPR